MSYSFIDGFALDGMRKHLLQDFTHLYHLDLGGNSRKTGRGQKVSNVFDIRVGVGITIAVRHAAHPERRVYYHALPETGKKEDKLAWLAAHTPIQFPTELTPIPQPLSPQARKGESDSDSPALSTGRGLGGGVKLAGSEVTMWQPLTPDAKSNWLTVPNAESFEALLPMGAKDAKTGKAGAPQTLFATYSGGIKTNRDEVVYDFQREVLLRAVAYLVEAYNAELDRYLRALKKGGVEINSFVRYERLKWDSTLKGHLRYKREATYDPQRVRSALYRPFCKQWLYFDRMVINSVHLQHLFFPTPDTEAENRVICLTDVGSEKPFMLMMTNCIVDLHLVGAGSSTQCFPFYTYAEDGTDRRENITDWALEQFQAHYADPSIGKWAIFHYIYAALHSPAYRQRFAAALKKNLPRIPFAADFWAYARSGAQLADLHVNYERATPYALHEAETGQSPLPLADRYRVTDKLQLTQAGTAVQVNVGLRLEGIPATAFGYKLGNRSALEWVLDQYQVKAGRDPNRADDPEYIVRLVKQLVAVSLETVRIVGDLPPLFEG